MSPEHTQDALDRARKHTDRAFEELRVAALRVKRERDELLAAIREIMGIYSTHSHADMHAVASDMVGVARAADAKVKER